MAQTDLTTLEAVMQRLAGVADADRGAIATLIAGLSTAVLAKCGRRTMGQVQTFTDLYDGRGTSQLYLRDFPIRSVTSVAVWGVAVTPSPDGLQAGYVFDQFRLALVPGTCVGTSQLLGVWPGKWPRGFQNIAVTFGAGYDTTTYPPASKIFNGAPADLGEAVTDFVVQQYKRKDWGDYKSKVLSQASETTSFRDWEMDPVTEAIITTYRREWGDA